MCKCNQNNKCSCNQNPCGCEKIDAKCVLYNGVCLSNLGICADTDLEEIIIIIDKLIQDILEQIEEAWTAANIGGGAEVYKGISSLGIHQFRTLIDSVSVNVVENENNISLAVDEDWLEDVIIRIVGDIIPDTELDSPLNSISITSTGTNKFELDLNPTTFVSPNGSVTITSHTIGGTLKINFQVNPTYIENLLPNIVNVGTGADIYKGKNGNDHEFRGITTQVTQPSNPGQLSGSITAGAVVDGDNVRIDLNFSSLTVIPQTFGVPEYYVNSANPNNGDGSAVNPYKTWELCKTAIGGTPDTSRNIRVIFQSSISSTEDLTLNGVDFIFQNNVTFTYTGTGPIIDYTKFTGTTNKQITLSGEGILRQQESMSGTLNALNIIGGDGTFSRTLSIRGNIEVRERERNSNPSSDPSNFVEAERKDGAGYTIYGYNEAFSKGTVYVSGRNTGGASLIAIYSGARLTIRDRINPAIQMEGSGSGSSAIVSDGTLQVLHIGKVVRYSTYTGTSPDMYFEPSTTIPRIIINDGYSIIFNDGTFKASYTGSTNSGGYSCLVEVKGKSSTGQNSTFKVGSESRFIVTQDVFYQNIFNVDSDAVVDLDNTNSGISGYNGTCYLKNFFYTPTTSTPNLRLVFGRIDFSGPGLFKHTNITNVPNIYWVFINGKPISSTISTSPDASLNNDIYTNSGVLTRD